MSAQSGSEKELSIVVPTKHEALCIIPLLERIERATQRWTTEVIFVDDSDDETPEVIARAKELFDFDILLITRAYHARVGGLGSAVVAGIKAARAEKVVIMDADLQHPPERIPEMLEHAENTNADVVICSRFVHQNGLGNLQPSRSLISRFFAFITGLLFPSQLKRITDPLTGYFFVRRSAVDIDVLKPNGYKILLEILIRNPQLRVTEIPFQLEERFAENSKATLREALLFASHLFTLRLVADTRFYQFLLVGTLGLVVNNLLMAVFVEIFGFHYLLSAILATQGSTLSNFLLSELWVFGSKQNRRSFIFRLGGYFLMNNLSILIRGPLLVWLVSGLGVFYLTANLISLAVIAMLRFILADRVIWSKHADEDIPKQYFYDIHGIVRMESNVRLPELGCFQVADRLSSPEIRIHVKPSAGRSTNMDERTTNKAIDLVDGQETDQRAASKYRNAISYDEGLGGFGFWIKINPGEITEVLASSLLKRSPHVLYTNVVEPLLRWTFVKKGFALVHGACISHNGQGVLITAQTDTGKTTTILKTLSEYPFSFLSDDMTILHRDGTILSFPKPLTISLHTLKAVNQNNLTFSERIMLQIQSRLHSKSGRWFGMLLDRLRLPAATLNAVVQMLVPPPKYTVERLIPGVKLADRTSLWYLALIERGGSSERILKGKEILLALIENAEDAYGFPPYPQLASKMSEWNGEDLHDKEREIISQALQGVPAAHLRSPNFGWWQRIPALYYGEPFGRVENPLSNRYPTIPRNTYIGRQRKPL